MAELAVASEHLQAALDRLQKVVESKAGQTAEIQAALEAAQRENAALRETADKVSERLDRAVTKLQTLLSA